MGFVWRGISEDQRRALAASLTDSVRRRIQSGRDAKDQPTRPLRPGYARLKQRRGKKPVRDLTLSGRTLASLQPTRNGIGAEFTGDPRSQRIAAANPTLIGVSPNDKRTVEQQISKMKQTFVAFVRGPR